MRLLVLGATGQLGARLAQRPGSIAIDRATCDLATLTPAHIDALLAQHQPTHLINAAAYTAVDKAEQEEALAMQVNAVAPLLLAEAAKRHSIPFLHCSTDYVFDGATGPYSEQARPNPLNAYGRSKLAGDEGVLAAGGRVFRLQWVFDATGRNFLTTMRKLLAERTQIAIVADQLGAPSFAGHVAQALIAARDVPQGLYHLVPQGHTSWHGFACAIAQALGSAVPIAPITSAEYPTPAARPKDARLDASKLAALGIAMPHWREGLKEALA